MTSQWYCCIKSQQYGPYPFEHLQHWVAEGRLQPDDHVCLVGQQQWSVVRNVPELIGHHQAAAGNFPQPNYSSGSYPQGDYTQGNYTQGDLFAQPQAPAESGFQFKTGPTSYAATSKVKRDRSLQWAGAVIMGTLAVLGCIARVARVVLQEARISEQRAQEERRQQQLYRMPSPPQISPRSFDANEFNQRNEKYRQPGQR